MGVLATYRTEGDQIVGRNNPSHAFVSYDGRLFRVMELPESLLKKSSGRKGMRHMIL